jgi:hypothetical protein
MKNVICKIYPYYVPPRKFYIPQFLIYEEICHKYPCYNEVWNGMRDRMPVLLNSDRVRFYEIVEINIGININNL